MKIKIVSFAERVARLEKQEKADQWERVFVIWPRETKSGEYSFLCYVERLPMIIRRQPFGRRGMCVDIKWRYRTVKEHR